MKFYDSEKDKKVYNQNYIIEKIQDNLLSEAAEIRKNSELDLYEKLYQVSVIFDTVKFLQGFEENVKILNKNELGKKWDNFK